MKNNYWTSEDNKLIERFYYAYTSSTSAQTRNYIFSKLQPKLKYLVSNAIQTNMSSWSTVDKEDVEQEAMLHLWQLLSNKLDTDKMQAVLNFMWVSTINFLYTKGRQSKYKKKPEIEYTDDYMTDKYCSNDIDDSYNTEELRIEIMIELDKKILQQRKVNRINTIYLILLKEYLIENNYNPIGWRKYVTEKLGIDYRNYWQINHILNIRTKIFNIDDEIN
jgi:hypothetical protein